MSFWTDERIGALCQHIEAGLTASQIGGELGCTKNAVVSKSHRLGVRLKGIAGQNMKGVRRVRPRQPASEETSRFRCTVLDFTNETCRWPITEDSPFAFCGVPSADLSGGAPYCPAHMRMAMR